MGNLIYLIFIVFIPIVLIFLKLKGKIGFKFVGMGILASILIGLIVNVSIEKEDIHEKFIETINLKNDQNYEKAKLSLRIILQDGSDSYNRIDERKIQDKEKFKKIKKELIEYYFAVIIKSINFVNKVDRNCKNLFEFEKELDQLNFGKEMLIYCGLLGADPIEIDGYNKILKIKISEKESLVDVVKSSCK